MQNADMAAALGVDTARIYAIAYAFDAGLAGLAGGILAPVSGVFPTIGESYIGRAFITVIGAAPRHRPAQVRPRWCSPPHSAT